MRAKERERQGRREREREQYRGGEREERTGGKAERHEGKSKRQDARRTMRAELGSDGIEDVGLMVTAAARFRRGSFSIATWAQRVRGETWPKVILHFFFLYFVSALSSPRPFEEEREEPALGRRAPGRGRQGAPWLLFPTLFF